MIARGDEVLEMETVLLGVCKANYKDHLVRVFVIMAT